MSAVGYGMGWRSSAAQGNVQGLANAMDMIPRFDNCMNAKLFRRVILAETVASDFGKLMYLSFIFAMRCHSDAIPERRAPLSMRLGTKAIQADISLLWPLEMTEGSMKLTLKLRKRENFSGPAPSMRPCFCDSIHFLSNGLCPVRDFRPLVSGVMPREFATPSLQGCESETHPEGPADKDRLRGCGALLGALLPSGRRNGVAELSHYIRCHYEDSWAGLRGIPGLPPIPPR